MLNEVLHLTKGDLSNINKPLHAKKKAEPNAGVIKKITIPLTQLLEQKLKDIQCQEQ